MLVLCTSSNEYHYVSIDDTSRAAFYLKVNDMSNNLETLNTSTRKLHQCPCLFDGNGDANQLMLILGNTLCQLTGLQANDLVLWHPEHHPSLA